MVSGQRRPVPFVWEPLLKPLGDREMMRVEATPQGPRMAMPKVVSGVVKDAVTLAPQGVEVKKGDLQPVKIVKATLYRIVPLPASIRLYGVEEVQIENDRVVSLKVVTEKDILEITQMKKQNLEQALLK